MFTVCRDYLAGQLRRAGIRSNVYTSEKLLLRGAESHVGAVLFESETFRQNGLKRVYKDQTGATRKRRRVLDRTVSFDVVIGDYTEDKVEETLERFLGGLDNGLNLDGNFIPLEIVSADWIDKEDSILKARVAVIVTVRFMGGVYRDSGFARLSRAEIDSITNGKETILYGNQETRAGGGRAPGETPGVKV